MAAIRSAAAGVFRRLAGRSAQSTVRAAVWLPTSGLVPSWMRSGDVFEQRHIAATDEERREMLDFIGMKSMDELLAKTVPTSIRLQKEPNMGTPLTESELLAEMKAVGAQNKVFRSFIGMGYYSAHLPSVLKRCILENPGWYTQYTPYQAEVAQGRLESLLNFQSMVIDMTGLDVANSSLLDEATAAAEAMNLCFSAAHDADKKAKRPPRNKVYVDSRLHPHSKAIMHTRASGFGWEIVEGNVDDFDFSDRSAVGVIVQYPDTEGCVRDIRQLVKDAHDGEALVACATDLLALAVIESPGALGCDIAFGSSQRFGIPLGYGGPHAAFFASREDYIRKLPGRLVGMSEDKQGRMARRLTLQTRETHIKRGKATSNICTAQALLANIAAMYAIYHGPDGIRKIADRVHSLTVGFAEAVKELGHTVDHDTFFDTLAITLADGVTADKVMAKARDEFQINLRKLDHNRIGISLDETTRGKDVQDLLAILSVGGRTLDAARFSSIFAEPKSILGKSVHARTTDFLTNPIFNTFDSETEIMRYCKYLENRDLSLVHSMTPLGSCTMKLNSAVEMQALTWPEFANIHPFVPADQAQGYQRMFKELREYLCQVTGYADVSLQPNSGAAGEYAGLMAIRRYFDSRGESQRHVCLIPDSAHGTNPASAVMAGMSIQTVKTTKSGEVDMDDLRKKAAKHGNELAAIMITYPSTFGVFDEEIRDICDLIHKHGGQVYLDGANMNAQTMLCRPGDYGADVSHLNLHKTFCIPHGGGGPGMGPIGVREHLVPFLPGHPMAVDSDTAAYQGPPVSAAAYGSSLISTIPWAYIRMMGAQGLKAAAANALLNANYMAKKLQEHYPVPFGGRHGFCAHEFIISTKAFNAVGIRSVDIAKRLMDYGFHAPTMSWPVPESLMIEPTESESKDELDRYVAALVSIREEIREVEEGKYPQDDNVLVNAPHSLQDVVSDNWTHPYSQEKAAFPLPFLRRSKFWTPVSRIDDIKGDSDLICSCPPMGAYDMFSDSK